MNTLTQAIINSISGEEMWTHLEKLCGWDRTSGTEGEYAAVDYVAQVLKRYGLPVTIHKFDAYLSYPEHGSLTLHTDAGAIQLPAKTRSFSANTGEGGITAEIVSIPGGTNMFKADNAVDHISPKTVGGKIVLSESGSRGSMLAAQAAGAVGYIHMWPSPEKVIHEGIVTPVWGTPTPETADRVPTIPIISIQHDDGHRIREQLQQGPVKATIVSRTKTGWSKLRMPVTDIPGKEQEFVLVAGHIDSWHLGATDNATGNVVCLELARVFHEHRQALHRGIRVAWWVGHSTGRYAGSAWYADHFWFDLNERCVAYINIDSPGSLGATDYSVVTAAPETAALVREAVQEITGQTPEIERPLRAGDQSFWGVGIPSLFMLLSNRPKGQRAAVGGCGMGWWWHTEDDTLDKADKDVLVKDAKIYAHALARLTGEERLPLDVSAQIDELQTFVRDLNAVAAEYLDLSAIDTALDDLKHELKSLPNLPVPKANAIVREVTHHLTALSFTRGNRFDHDPAVPTPPLPSLDAARKLPTLDSSSDTYGFMLTSLVRARNAALYQVKEAIKTSRQLKP